MISFSLSLALPTHLQLNLLSINCRMRQKMDEHPVQLTIQSILCLLIVGTDGRKSMRSNVKYVANSYCFIIFIWYMGWCCAVVVLLFLCSMRMCTGLWQADDYIAYLVQFTLYACSIHRSDAQFVPKINAAIQKNRKVSFFFDASVEVVVNLIYGCVLSTRSLLLLHLLYMEMNNMKQEIK